MYLKEEKKYWDIMLNKKIKSVHSAHMMSYSQKKKKKKLTWCEPRYTKKKYEYSQSNPSCNSLELYILFLNYFYSHYHRLTWK